MRVLFRPAFSGQPQSTRPNIPEATIPEKRFREITRQCLYCGDAYMEKRSPLTDEHLRPQTAFDKGDLRKNQMVNWACACADCNQQRSNTPLLEFINGQEGLYHYGPGGDSVRCMAPRKFPKSKPAQKALALDIQKRKVAFSEYLKFFVSHKIRINGSPEPNSWFTGALDNLLYPMWGTKKQKPTNSQELEQDRVLRTRKLVTTLSEADAQYWLGKAFRQVITEDFRNFPAQQKALHQAVTAVRELYPQIQTRFSPIGTPRPVLNQKPSTALRI